ncbi:MAG: type I-C CRISPR-associated endonuclease Cas1 [candidate division WS1 bacterium]|nr:type I-C CRISPR-associated endonuclease Cas1 [candidate division WS1 bacterium]
MRHLLNTLYVTTQGSYLSKEGETVCVRVEKETKLRLPFHNLGGVVCFGQVSCSPYLMGACAEKDILISFLTEHGRFLARVSGPVSGNVLLRRAQYRCADAPEFCASVAKSIVVGKVANSRAVLTRAVRDHPGEGTAPLQEAAKHLRRVLNSMRETPELDSVRGIEGDAAREYFSVFDHLIVAQRDAFSFAGRSRRPPMDPVNALLSFIYTLVLHDVTAAIESVGLDPAVGYLHRDRPGRPGLALDLMEELRAYIADRLALSLINRRQVEAKGFDITESGGVTMDEETRKIVLKAYQKRKQEEITHPFIDEKMPLGLIPFVQALLFARLLRGELDAYPPFLWR